MIYRRCWRAKKTILLPRRRLVASPRHSESRAQVSRVSKRSDSRLFRLFRPEMRDPRTSSLSLTSPPPPRLPREPTNTAVCRRRFLVLAWTRQRAFPPKRAFFSLSARCASSQFSVGARFDIDAIVRSCGRQFPASGFLPARAGLITVISERVLSPEYSNGAHQVLRRLFRRLQRSMHSGESSLAAPPPPPGRCYPAIRLNRAEIRAFP